MPLHLALQILQRLVLGLSNPPEDIRNASETLRQAIHKACHQKTLFTQHSPSEKEEIENELFSTLLFRLKNENKYFPTKGQAYAWMHLSIRGFLLDRHKEQQGLIYLADLQNDENPDQEPDSEDRQPLDPEDELARRQALQDFYAQKEAFVADFLQTISAKKREQVRDVIEEMEAIHVQNTLSVEEVMQQRAEKKNTIQKRHSHLRKKLQAHLQQLGGPKISRRIKEVLFAWLALLDGKPGQKYDT